MNTEVINEEDLLQQDENILFIGETGFMADADQIIVMVDEFRSGYECQTCFAKDLRMVSSDKQVSFVKCKECDGKGKRPKVGNKNIEVNCTECNGSGAVPCPDCGGTGGIIAIPDNQKPAVTTGEIVSIGPLVPKDKRKIGERVLFGSYSGSRYDVTGKLKNGAEKAVELRFLRDDEVKAKLFGRLQFRAMKGARALYTNQ